MNIQQKELEKVFDNVSMRIEQSRADVTVKIFKDVQQYVPYRTGALSKSGLVVNFEDDNESDIYWGGSEAPYAQHVYYMPETNNFNTSKHKFATSNWIEVAKAENMGRWIRSLKSSVRKGGN